MTTTYVQHHAEVSNEVGVSDLGRPTGWAARCDCGWFGLGHPSRGAALDDADDHVNYATDNSVIW